MPRDPLEVGTEYGPAVAVPRTGGPRPCSCTWPEIPLSLKFMPNAWSAGREADVLEPAVAREVAAGGGPRRPSRSRCGCRRLAEDESKAWSVSPRPTQSFGFGRSLLSQSRGILDRAGRDARRPAPPRLRVAPVARVAPGHSVGASPTLCGSGRVRVGDERDGAAARSSVGGQRHRHVAVVGRALRASGSAAQPQRLVAPLEAVAAERAAERVRDSASCSRSSRFGPAVPLGWRIAFSCGR